MKARLAALAFALLAAGCTVKTVDAPVTVTTKPLPDLSRSDVVAGAKEVSGSSCSRVVLGFIPVGIATVESAVEEALSQAPGADTLLRYEERQSYVVALLYYQVCTEVHGYAVSSKTLAAR